jgi:HEPN domain-containing protein
MTRWDLQKLAEDRLLDAEALLAAGRWSAAYYLAGYAVECAIKACIAKLVQEYDFRTGRRSWTATALIWWILCRAAQLPL